MIRVIKGKAPKTLLTHGKARARDHCKRYDARPAKYNAGAAKFEFASNIYGHKSVKTALEKAQNGKCCYCEAVIPKPYALSHVDHYRPKGYSQQAAKGPKRYPGYYWLAYDWGNLFLACHFCNSVNKRNRFPLLHEAKCAKNHHANIDIETALIVRPDGPGDPGDHIGFHNEVPVGKTPAGVATINVLGLDRHEHEQRLRLFKQLQDSHSILLRYRRGTSRAAREIVAQAYAVLSTAVRTDAPFSAMAITFLERNPLPPP
jgi:uncharacterized protein (TIGR02646 family)